MTSGQILDRIYRLMRANLRLFFGVAAVPSATIFVFLTAMLCFMIPLLGPQMDGQPTTPLAPPPYFPFIVLLGYPITLVVYALYMPAASFATTKTDLGISVSFRQAYVVAWSRFGRYLWLMILCILCVVVPITVIAALIAAGVLILHHAASVGAGPAGAFFLVPLLVLLYLGIFVYCVLIMLRLAVAYPACVEEGLTAWAAVRRSAGLTRNAKGRIFLVMLVVYAVTYAVNLVCILVLFALAAIGTMAAVGAHVTLGSPAFFILAGLGILGYLLVIVAATMLSCAAMTTAMAVLYHDQRLRMDALASMPPQA